MPGLNNYRLIKRLSTGLVDTFIAENLGHSQEKYSVVRVFNLSAFSIQQRQYVSNLLEESSSIISKISPHVQVAQITNYFWQEPAFYLVETYISGHGLDVEITPGKRLSESYAIALLQNTLIPLDWLHQQNIVHGNIHPGNLIRRQQDGKIILTDLGRVKQVWQGAIHSLNPQPIILKNIHYLPPRSPLDRRTFDSDIYALGAIALQALTGLSIQQLANPETRELVWHHQIQIAPGLSKILGKMVHPDERERYRSAREVLLALETEKADLKVINQATVRISPRHNSAGKNQLNQPENSAEKTVITPSMPNQSIGKLSLVAWIAANCAGISLGFYLSWVVAYLGSFLANQTLVSAIFGFTFGLVLGTSQGLVIKGIIHRGCWWIGLTTLASSLGFFLGNIVANSLGNLGGELVKGAILGGILGAIAGIPQSLVLRSQLGKGSGWWLTTAIAGVLCALIATIIPGWGIPLGGIMFGIITGISLR
ncbi:protein kinase domain-containing protein [Merismopedia glauca]|uniref:non-specific serine/threonine protein kinase n=1 Tax=Merismopedia glauca CCAP 1448/3 TaxID=1296344 RepID=A0A2T1BYS7_9CYAN|nr:hypothetical protein [Merismopedia glauca]PSB01048.1 hypothetical protein C7B64_20325 [Merismopedia glauca CCAP 1448/3]